MKLMEEEEKAEFEMQVVGNVVDDEIQQSLDEEALNLALEEEAAFAKADQERLQHEEEEYNLLWGLLV